MIVMMKIEMLVTIKMMMTTTKTLMMKVILKQQPLDEEDGDGGSYDDYIESSNDNRWSKQKQRPRR